MAEIEIRLREVSISKAWEAITPNLTIALSEHKATSYFVYRFIEAAYPELGVCEVRWNVKGSHQGHYFEYRR